MPTFAFGLQYNGTAYRGWQFQVNVSSIQAVVESAITQLANEKIQVICAGRTDAGVHAMNQVIHFHTTAIREAHAWLRGTNSYLPRDVSVQWIKEVSSDFHARYSATARRYQYVIYNHPVRSSVLYNAMTWWYKTLDVDLMHQAGQYLIGKHDFSSFRGPHCQSHTPIRCVQQLQVRRYKDWVIIDITANAFLQHMVRNIVGVLLEVGENEHPPQWVAQVLAAKDRRCAGRTAPAEGLYFMDVSYPAHFKLPRLSVDDTLLPFIAL